MLTTRLVGQTFGRLTVVGRSGSRPVGSRGKTITVWACLCACGASCFKTRVALQRQKYPSCGCSYAERHGKTKTPEYRIWKQIKQACSNPKDHRWHSHGNLGVRVCPQWVRSFSTFIRDVGRRPSRRRFLMRIDPHGDFQPGNVRWTPWAGRIQIPDLRVPLKMGGEIKTLAEWGEALGISRKLLRRRLNYGWSPTEVLRSRVRKLTPEAVFDIARRYRSGEVGAALAAEYGVIPDVVYRIANKTLWKKLQESEKRDRHPPGGALQCPSSNERRGLEVIEAPADE